MIRPSTTKALAKATVASDTSQAGSAGASAATMRKASAPITNERSPMTLDLSRLGTREQAPRPEHEHQRHDRINDEQLDLRREMHRRSAAQADNERTDKGAVDRPHAADRHHREGEHDHLDTDAERHRDLRRHDRPAERAQHGAEDERGGIDHRNIDAARGRQLAIENHHGEEAAPSGVFERPARSKSEQSRESDEA